MDSQRGETPAKLIEQDSKRSTAPDDGEPTEKEIRTSIRRSMQQALSGETRPAEEALEEIRRELVANADKRQDH